MATATRPDTGRAAPSTSFSFALARVVLLDALSRAATALPTRSSTLPILNTVLIQARAGEITLLCSDLERIVETRVSGVVSGTGAAALPAKRLVEIVSTLPNSATVEFTVTERKARIVAGRSKFDVIGMPVDEFPLVDVPKAEASATADGRVFVTALGRAGTHVASSEKAGSLPALAGVLLEIDERGAHLVGTDRHRFAQIGVELKAGERPLLGAFVIPKTAIGAITKLFGDEESITLEGSKQKLVISGSWSTLILSLIGEKYPNYKQFLSLPTQGFAVLDRALLVDAIKRVAAVADDDHVEFLFAEQELTLRASTPDSGAGEDVIASALSPGGMDVPYRVAFNPAYVVTALKALACEQVRLDFAGWKNPLYLRDAATPTSTTMTLTLPLHPRLEASKKGGA